MVDTQEWDCIPLNKFFDAVKEARANKQNVIINDTTDNVANFYQYNPHSKLFDFHKELLKVRAGTKTKEEALEFLRQAALVCMRNGTTMSINLDVLPCDFKNEWTDPELLPTNIFFDYALWRKDQAFLKIVREDDMIDIFGSPINVFPFNTDFHIAIITSIKNENDLKALTDTIPSIETFLKLKVA